MTPAPMTQSRFGTALELERAPGIHDVLAVELDAAQRIGSDPEARTTCLACKVFLPRRTRELDLAAWQQLAVTGERRDAGGLERAPGCPASSGGRCRFALLHRRDVEGEPSTSTPCAANSCCARW
jgi:hypothetical protein